MSETKKNYILDADKALMKLKRMAYEILENNSVDDSLIIAGISGNGTIIADIIVSLIREISDIIPEQMTIELDKQQPTAVNMYPEINIDGKVVIIVDDVTNSGKTITYGLKPLLDHHPKKIQTLVLVERSHTKFPVHANYVGHSLSTFLHEHIIVEVEGKQVKGAYVA